MKKIIFGILFISFFKLSAYSKTFLTIGTASNFDIPLRKISALYKKENQDIEIKISSGASGVLANQIITGAPFDIFFSADKKYIEFLENNNKILPNSSFNFAIGKLILWQPKSSIKKLTEKDIYSLLTTIKGPIAVADASIAPFGFATSEYLKNSFADITRKPKNFIYGRNIEQTANYISTGSAQCGFISLSNIIDKINSEEYWIVPSNKYSPIIQMAAIIKQSNQIQESLKFIKFFTTNNEVKKIILDSGYSLDFNKT